MRVVGVSTATVPDHADLAGERRGPGRGGAGRAGAGRGGAGRGGAGRGGARRRVRTGADGVGPDMTQTESPDAGRLETARRMAAAHTAAARDVEAFLRRLPAVPEPTHITEYATLVAREEELRAERTAALDALGLELPSLGPA
ncbi:hypothetical protein GCM10009779_07020 [Polymorphospora rubra]